ncbi:DNA-binding protein [Streptomyces sp. NPDC047079]|uniref:WD40 repeat domain-containing protein n=1 Tax=Streptomyces sp. NPDC047079 TaxID=3154607 RepID=UPI0033D879EB
MAQRGGQGASTLSQAAGGERLPTLPVVLAYVGACGGDPEEWERRWRQAAAEVAAEPRAEDEDAEPPYRGLARFEPGDADVFFGRDELTDRLLTLTRSRRFSAVFGPSGSGKSSLLRAGLIPRLRNPDQATPQPAALRVLTPGEHPLRTHEQRLTPNDGDGDTWLIVDQFEELYTLCHDQVERDQFIGRLLTATDPGSRLRVVIAVRADFLGRCAEHPGLTAALQDGTVLVGPMSRDELRQAIVKPAQAAGLIVERGLTARILNEVEGEPGALPLVSHVLRETWRRRRGRALSEEAYEAAGGVHGAIAQTAEDVYAGLSAEHAQLARLVLLRLITPGEGSQDTRRPVDRSELDFAPGPTSAPHTPVEAADVSLVLDRLARARLITLDQGTVDLAHEALITAWPRLSGWIDEKREQLRVHRRLTEAARAWDELGRDSGALYRGTRLAAAREQLYGASLTPLEQAFLNASSAARQGERRRRRGLVGALAVLVVLALVAGAVAWQQNRTSDRRREEAEARRTAAVADGMRFSDPVTAMRLSVAAWRLADTTETRSALIGAMAQREQDVFAVPGADAGFDGSDNQTRRLTADGRSVVSVTADRVRIWDLRTRRLTLSAPGPGKLMADGTSAVVGPDGRTLALPTLEDGIKVWDVRSARVTSTLAKVESMDPEVVLGERTLAAVDVNDGYIHALDLHSGRRIPRIPAPGGSESAMTFSSDGRWLAWCADMHPEIWDLAHHRKASASWAVKVRAADCTDHSLAFTPDSRSLTVVIDHGIGEWDLRTGRRTLFLEADGLNEVWFGSDGRFLVATGPRRLLVWRTAYPDLPVLRQRLTADDWSDVALDLPAGAVRYLNTSGTVVRSLSLGRATTKLWPDQMADQAELSGDGRILARILETDDRQRLQVLDTHDGRMVFEPEKDACPGKETEGEGACAGVMALSGDGRYLARSRRVDSNRKGTPGGTRITVWDVRTGREYATVGIRPDHDGSFAVNGLALDAHAHTLLVYRQAFRPTVEVWDVRREKHVKTVRSSRSATSVDESDSVRIALRPDNGSVVTQEGLVADLRAGRMAPRVLGDELISTAAFSPDGTRLAVGDAMGRVTLWDGAPRTRLGVLDGSLSDAGADTTGPVSALAFSHDGRTLAVGGWAGTVQLWDVPSQRLLGSALPTPGDKVLALSFGSDDGTLYASGTNVPVQKYDITSAHLAAQVCKRSGSGLSKRDWKTYLPNVPYHHTC